jgi:hypothetical protein
MRAPSGLKALTSTNPKNKQITTVMITKKYIVLLTAVALCTNVLAQSTVDRPRPAEWNNLVYGGRFMDLFQPMPNIGQPTSDTWGDPNVVPRYVDNGIENRAFSFWGGNKVLGDDGKFHLFVCGWRESSPKGHATWPNSTVYHAVSDNLYGPFVVQDTIGKGHNPEVFRLKDGRYVLYVIDGCYTAPNVNGPWTYGKLEYLTRDRRLIEGNSNFSFAQRKDGSYLMICRGGGQWISQTGDSPYHQVTGTTLATNGRVTPLRAYPAIPGRFEDPVVWRDQVQYHLIVNDWQGRIAYYLRSKDGVSWKAESGEAYLPGVSVREDRHVEQWFKYERIKVFQDTHGRAIQANFAVIDTDKSLDKGGDNHSSKNISIPLTAGRLLAIIDKDPVTEKTRSIRVRVFAEPGFNPQTDIDLNSLQFGDPEAVNYGKGGAVLTTEKAGKDLIITFKCTGQPFPQDEFAAKMIGKTTEGTLLFGYARLPWVNFNAPILSPLLPTFNTQGSGLMVEVQNFGFETSKAGAISVSYFEDGQEFPVARGNVPALKPYEKAVVELPSGISFEKGKAYTMAVTISSGGDAPVTLHGAVTPIR